LVAVRASEGTKMLLVERDLPSIRLVELLCAVRQSPGSTTQGSMLASFITERIVVRNTRKHACINGNETGREVRSRLSLFVYAHGLFCYANHRLPDAHCV